jgi:hypothetical protein
MRESHRRHPEDFGEELLAEREGLKLQESVDEPGNAAETTDVTTTRIRTGPDPSKAYGLTRLI